MDAQPVHSMQCFVTDRIVSSHFAGKINLHKNGIISKGKYHTVLEFSVKLELKNISQKMMLKIFLLDFSHIISGDDRLSQCSRRSKLKKTLISAETKATKKFEYRWIRSGF